MTGASYIHFVFRLFRPMPYDSSDEKEEPEETKKDEVKYEDKYWDLFKRADNDFVISKDIVIAQRMEQLATCVLFETTPVGNVIMNYNVKNEAFEYYSDCTIPNRYLDTVCRKYAATFGCKPLYIDMNEQVKESEAKTKLLRESNAKEKEKETEKVNPLPIKKKNVFAKFKTYNKDSGLGGAPPKNSLPGGKKMEDSEPVVIKERTNKFLFLGKTRNFITGKKIEQKEKKVSFADFKKMFKK